MPDNQNIVTPIPGVDNLTYAQVNTIVNFEKIWMETVMWMRNFIRSSLENLPDLATVTARVFQQLPMEFYNEFSKYYSPADSQQFFNIATRLVGINWQLVNAYKNNDTAAIDASTRQWYQSANEAAAFLARVNRHYDESQVRTMLYQYIQLKIQEIIAFLGGNYDQELQVFEELENLALRIGAYMAEGIIANQPQRIPTPRQQAFVWTARKTK